MIKHHDYENKAVVWCMRIAFAFTGLAELGDERRTDLWLASALAKIEEEANPAGERRDQAWLLQRVAEVATIEFTTPALRRLPAAVRRHGFVGVGWGRFSGAPALTPYRALVSNFHDDDLAELPEAQEAFRIYVRKLDDSEGGLVEAFPEALGRERMRLLIDKLSSADAAGAEPAAMTKILGEEIRRASRFNRRVGRGLLINVIPRTAIEVPSGIMLSGHPVADQPSFLYVPAQSWETVSYGPTTVCGGRIMSNFTLTPL